MPMNRIKRPFYIIGHNTNTIAEVRDVLERGANAVECDINVSPSGKLCVNHNAPLTEGGANSLEPYLAELRRVADEFPRLAMVMFDSKIQGPDQGRLLLDLIRAKLTADINLPIIISVASRSMKGFFDKIHTDLRPHEGLMIDQENDPVAIEKVFEDLGVVNRCYGNGLFVAGVAPNVRTAMEHAAAMKAMTGKTKWVYSWTLGKMTSMREHILLGVDGIIVNDIQALVQIVNEPAIAADVRMAERSDDPFVLTLPAYGLVIKTDPRGHARHGRQRDLPAQRRPGERPEDDRRLPDQALRGRRHELPGPARRRRRHAPIDHRLARRFGKRSGLVPRPDQRREPERARGGTRRHLPPVDSSLHAGGPHLRQHALSADREDGQPRRRRDRRQYHLHAQGRQRRGRAGGGRRARGDVRVRRHQRRRDPGHGHRRHPLAQRGHRRQGQRARLVPRQRDRDTRGQRHEPHVPVQPVGVPGRARDPDAGGGDLRPDREDRHARGRRHRRQHHLHAQGRQGRGLPDRRRAAGRAVRGGRHQHREDPRHGRGDDPVAHGLARHPGQRFRWFLDSVVASRVGGGASASFNFSQWIVTGAPVTRTPSVASYTLAVKTGSVGGAGTDANITFTLKGALGSVSQTVDARPAGLFEAGATNSVKIQGMDIGAITALTVSHDTQGNAPDWYLTSVNATKAGAGVTKNFVFDQWIYAGQPVTRTPSDASYTLVVKTSVVHVVDTKPAGLFEAGQTNTLTFKGADVGNIQSLTLSHDSQGNGPDWFVASVTASKVGSGVTKTFVFDQWIFAPTPVTRTPADVAYTLVVKTGNKSGAGTDANITFVLKGSQGTLSKIVDADPAGLFEAGYTNNVTLQGADIGPLTTLSVTHDDEGNGPGWFVDSIVVKKGGQALKTFVFNQWVYSGTTVTRS